MNDHTTNPPRCSRDDDVAPYPGMPATCPITGWRLLTPHGLRAEECGATSSSVINAMSADELIAWTR
jgi:hypothetical protein